MNGMTKRKSQVLDVERRDDEPWSERGEKSQNDKGWQGDQPPARHKVIPAHEADEDDKGNEEIHGAHHHGTGGNDEPREVDFGNKIGIPHHALARRGQGVGKKLPGQERGEDHDGIGRTSLTGKSGEFAEHDAHDDHR